MKRFIIIITVFALLTGCDGGAQTFKDTQFMLDTIVTITIIDGGDLETIDAAMDEIRRLEKILSRTIKDSEISKINDSSGEMVEISKETYEVLSAAQYYSRLKEGCFDITIGSVSSLWNFKQEDPRIPSKEELTNGLKAVGSHNLELKTEDDKYFAALKEGSALDLGAIAKGYISDKVRELLLEKGVRSAIIDLGGNILLVGSKAGNPFNIGVRDPSSPNGIIAILELSYVACVSSGSYERFIEVDGITYHHILDPKTGMSAESDLSGITIVTETGMAADALSTICFILGKDAGMSFVEGLDGTEAVFVDKENKVTYTSGLEGIITLTEAAVK